MRRSIPPRTQESERESRENLIVSGMRLLLAVTALAVILIDPSEPDRLIAITYAVLFLYVIYSTALYWADLRGLTASGGVYRWAHWADVAWYTLLISLSSGTNSVFYFGFYFPILVASFRWGYAAGMQVTIVSTVLFTVLGYITGAPYPGFQLNRFLLRSTYLLLLGYMVSYWGGYEDSLRRRLSLLREVTTMSNPRFGVGRTVGSMLERLRAFFDVDTCLFVAGDPDTGNAYVHRSRRGEPEAANRAETIAEDLARELLGNFGERSVSYLSRRRGAKIESMEMGPGTSMAQGSAAAEACERVATLLESSAFLSVPFEMQRGHGGRLYVSSSRRGEFQNGDLEFLLQVTRQVATVIENIRLVDRLASSAADDERRRIARDIHDSIIQPYIGLQFGLAGIREKLTSNGHDVRPEVDQLLDITRVGIEDLRRYVARLKHGGEYDTSLLASFQRFAERFSEATGISVQVEATRDIRIGGRLAAEAFQMLVEGLSNARRHSDATQAYVTLDCRDGRLLLIVENDGAQQPSVPFVPVSINDRAQALGGTARVEHPEAGRTRVQIEIPL